MLKKTEKGVQNFDTATTNGARQIALIADKSTCIGFKLAGVQTSQIIEYDSKPEVISSAIEKIIEDPDIQFILITEKLVERFGLEKFEKFRKDISEQVIIIVIPDSEGSQEKIGQEHLWRLIQRAVGRKRSD